jgi:diguanylate cyclase (GGDEF)-like protein
MGVALDRATLESLPVQLAVLDHSGSLLLVNREWRRFAESGGCSTCNEGANFFDVCERASGRAAIDAGRAAEGAHRVLDGALPFFAMDVRCDTPRGTHWYTQQIAPFAGDGGGVTLTYTDITARKELEDLTRHRATHDPLTGLPNRLLIHDRLAQGLASCRRTGSPLAVLFVDVDRFKSVNDLYGHAAGDAVLVEVARRLRGVVRPADTVGRLAGDEFIVVAAPADADVAGEIAHRIRDALRPAVVVAGRTVPVTASVGVHVGNRWEEHPEDLLQLADLAMFRAKRANRVDTATDDLGVDAEYTHSVQRLLHLLRLTVGTEVAWTSELVGSDLVHRFADVEPGVAGPTPGGRPCPAPRFANRLVEESLPGLVPDVRAHRDGELIATTFEWQIGAYVGAPLPGPDGLPFGVLGLSSPVARPTLRDDERVSASLVAEVIGDLHHRALRLAASERRRDDLRAVVLGLCRGPGRQLVLQPIVDLRSGAAVAVEALTRFTDASRDPGQWFAAASAVGLGRELEIAAADAALRLPTDAAPAVSVNLSPDAILGGALDDLLDHRDPRGVIVEVTEHAAVSSYERLEQALAAHRAHGLRLAVDDVGAGYASLTHVLRMRPDILKIDISLVRGIDADPVRQALVAAMDGFSTQLGATLVAEGVETASELAQLLDLGVAHGQGFLLGRPAPPATDG